MIIHFYRRFHLFRPVLRIGPRTLHPRCFGEESRILTTRSPPKAHQDTLPQYSAKAHQDNLQNIRQVHQETHEEMRQAMRQSEATRLQRPNLETPFGEDAAQYLPQ